MSDKTMAQRRREALIHEFSWLLSRKAAAVEVGHHCPYLVAREIVTVIDEATERENVLRSAKLRRWHALGCCPRCGEVGAMVACAPVCSVHGPYEFVGRPDPDAGYDPEEFFGEEDGGAEPAFPPNHEMCRCVVGARLVADDTATATAALFREKLDGTLTLLEQRSDADPEPSPGWRDW